jgi:exonuclease III
MLRAHYRHRILSMQKIAVLGGYKEYRAGNLQYGSLCRRIADELGFVHPSKTYTIATGWKNDSQGHFQWRMDDAVVTALRQLRWFPRNGNGAGLSVTTSAEAPVQPAPKRKTHKLRIVVWNCRMAFSKKKELLYKLRPDIAVLPECSKDAAMACIREGYSAKWWGENKHKGLAVLAATPWTLKVRRSPTERWIRPVEVHGPTSFLLLAVWACQVSERELSYIGQVFESIRKHPQWFKTQFPVFMCGDFNSNGAFRGHGIRNHMEVVSRLERKGLFSAYHKYFSEEQGQETRYTHYFQHQQSQPFHIDHVFCPRKWVTSIHKVTVGTYKRWRPFSDHVPVVVDLSLRRVPCGEVFGASVLA